jgi:peptidoglycan/xylan/chitin deacetylase (PgdA/CDA1 family)
VRLAAKTVFAAGDLVLPRLKGPRILIYHQVGTNLGREMEVTRQDFVSQLDWMQTSGRIVPFDAAVAARGTEGSDRLYALTFDDGYRDVYEIAWPLLRERQLPFLLYVTTAPVESQRPLNRDQARPLNWDQIGDMLTSGLLTLGAHTHNHPDLRRCAATEIEHELVTSDGIIEKRTSHLPRHFAYPWGYWSAHADAMIRARYETAALGGPVVSDPFTDDHLVSRLPVQRSDGFTFFKARMRNGLRLEERTRRRLRGYRAI